ncbi:MAG: hypothetical protein J6Y02_03980 [Pseudobutyrivibrio sp.]|nr:hypothetical protein [Pseudobutyrivibrio sp.]
MMNSNELMEDLLRTLKNSGWLDKANEFYQNHPEYYHPAEYSGLISNLVVSVSYQPESLSAVADVIPSIFIGMGNVSGMSRELIQYSRGNKKSRVWINSNIVSEVPVI